MFLVYGFYTIITIVLCLWIAIFAFFPLSKYFFKNIYRNLKIIFFNSTFQVFFENLLVHFTQKWGKLIKVIKDLKSFKYCKEPFVTK